jgi:transcriptional regulator with XRE-family HTH domain
MRSSRKSRRARLPAPPDEPPAVNTEPLPQIEARLHDLGEFIRDQRRNARLSLRKLSERAGISNPYLSQIERGLRKPSAEILQSIARGLRISAETLYVRAGILDEPTDDAHRDLISTIVADPTLNDRQKQVLMEIYRSFQVENAAQDVG